MAKKDNSQVTRQYLSDGNQFTSISRLWGLNNAHQQISIDFTIKSTGFTNRIRDAPPYPTTRLYSSPSYFYLLTLFSLEKGNHTPSQKHIWKKRKKFWRAIYSQFHQNSTFAWRHTKKAKPCYFLTFILNEIAYLA